MQCGLSEQEQKRQNRGSGLDNKSKNRLPTLRMLHCAAYYSQDEQSETSLEDSLRFVEG